MWRLLSEGTPFAVPALVLYEWLRGPRSAADLQNQEDLFPSKRAISFGHEEASIAARLYRTVRRARSREIDIGIAAIAIRHEAELWTLNRADFSDIPGLRLFIP
jgi:predicted nucleic acid-binding protein